MAQEKVNLYLLAIVAIVAVVGIVVLVMNAGTTALSVSDGDITGQVARVGALNKQSAGGCSSTEMICGAGNCCDLYTQTCVNSKCV